jgi:HAE1 family hydrophobic/amphiphilic exporter-1
MKMDGRDRGEPQPSRQRLGGAAQKLAQFSSGLSRPFIERPVMTMLLSVSVLVFGLLSYNQLAVNDLPAVDYPVISVSASYPGADPVTMANTIATPLEKQFTQIPGISLIASNSTQGNTNITIQFDLSKSIDGAASDVQSAIQRAQRTTARRSAQPADIHQSKPE